MIPREAESQKLHHEKALNALVLAFEQYWFSFQSTSSAFSLVQELVVIVTLASSDLARSRDLESLRCRLVRSNFWHL